MVSGGASAASIIMTEHVDAIILDHDMPYGNGSDLITWMHSNSKMIQIYTSSGIPQNNEHMKRLCDSFRIPCVMTSKNDWKNRDSSCHSELRKYLSC